MPVSVEENVVNSSSVKVTEKISGVDKNELYTIINCVGKMNHHISILRLYTFMVTKMVRIFTRL